MQRIYYVAFKDNDGWKWWDLFTTKAYRHCFVFYRQWVPDGPEHYMDQAPESLRTIYIEISCGCLTIEPYVMTPEELIEYLSKSEQNITIVRIFLDPSKHLRYRGRGLITCVSLIKAILGLNKFWIVTPRQLIQHLRRLGAETVLEVRNEKKGSGQRTDRVAESPGTIAAGQGARSETGENRA